MRQLRLRDYFLDQNKAPIGPDDIINIFPVVKHLDMPIVDASKAFRAAQKSIQKGRVRVCGFSVKCERVDVPFN